MTRYLTIDVRLHGTRYHGGGGELPSPFRLFQALVAGAGISGPLDPETEQAFAWLEGLPDAPIIASPRVTWGQAVTMFMPNNDLDKFGGDVRNIAKTRGAKKVWKPHLFDASASWIYAWRFTEDRGAHAERICALAEKLYQLGRGVDMAWAWGEVLDAEGLEARLNNYPGVVRRPGAGPDLLLACPEGGSLAMLKKRYQAQRFRLDDGRRVFVQQPKPSYRMVAYDSPPARFVFELRSSTDLERRVTWPIERAALLVAATREAARSRLSTAMQGREGAEDVDRYLVGRNADGTPAMSAERRVRIIPIPSIGMHFADRAIRRLLVETPALCPLRSKDIHWAFSGSELSDADTGAPHEVLLVSSAADDMLRHYGVDATARVFRSVTPVVLPSEAKRRRIAPTRKLAEAKPGFERVLETSAARAAVVQALRHAGVHARVEQIRLQREPFESAGSRAEPFAVGTRFEKERLWHVEIAFGTPVSGPLVLGDGRFLGLGLMAPVRDLIPGVHAFEVVGGLADQADSLGVARALRRAVMARVQAISDSRHTRIDSFFSGHADNGEPIRQVRSSHLSFAFVPDVRKLVILAPHVVEHRAPNAQEIEHLRSLDAALEGFCELRAGAAGCFSLIPASSGPDDDSLFGSSRVWRTLTSYVAMRHAKAATAADALASDVRAACRRIGLPEPRVESSDIRGTSGIGLTGDVTLTFTHSVQGPLLLGRTRFLGGGLFRPLIEDAQR